MAAHTFGRLATTAAVAGRLGPGSALDSAFAAESPPARDPWPWAVNWFSGILALATLLVVARAPAGLPSGAAGGALAAALLVAGPTFRAQAVVANIRMPTTLLAAAVLLLALRWLGQTEVAAGDGDEFAGHRRTVRDAGGVEPARTVRHAGGVEPASVAHGDRPIPGRPTLVATAFVFGLAGGHHSSLVFLGLPVAAVVMLRRPAILRDARLLAALALSFAVALLPLAYLPLRDRAGAVLAPGTLSTAEGFLYHVLALGFRGDAFYFGDVATLVDRLAVLANILWLQFGWTLALVALGAAWLARTRPLAALLVLGAAAVVAALGVVYRAPQTMEYLLPAYAALAIAGGCAAGWLQGRAARWGHAIALAAAAAVVATRALYAPAAPPPDMTDTSLAALDCAPANGTILASWHFAPPLWHAARHMAPRPDVTVDYVQPEGAEPIGETWRRVAADATSADASGTGLILTNRTRELVDAGMSLWPVPRTPFFATGPVACIPLRNPERPLAESFGDVVRLESVYSGTGSSYVDHTSFDLAFRATRTVTEPLTVVAQLVGGDDGAVWGQVDHSHTAVRWNDPRGLVDRVTLLPFVAAPPSQAYDVAVGVYRTTADGPVRLSVDGAESVVVYGDMPPSTGRTFVPLPPGAIPFGDALALVGHAIRRANGMLVVDLDWRAARAYVSDYTVSVQVHGDGWTAQDDGTPALGAIPTLKWVPGMVIHDRHRIALPKEAESDAYRVTVGVYDAFSLEPLPVTDAERVRAGEGQAVTLVRRE